MLQLSVDNWGMMDVSSNISKLKIMCIYNLHVSLLASYPLISHGSEDPLPFHLDNVHCTGNESKLSDCDHLGFGVHNCAWEFEEAGVVCTSRPLSSKLTYCY